MKSFQYHYLSKKWKLEPQTTRDTISCSRERLKLKTPTTQCAGNNVPQLDLTCTVVGLRCKMVQILWRTVGHFLIGVNTHLTYTPAIPLLCIY